MTCAVQHGRSDYQAPGSFARSVDEELLPGVQAKLDCPAGQHRTTGLEPLAHNLHAKFVKTT
jgi:hypothetical protein